MSEEKLELRTVTYMCPTHPVQLYELILELLEDAMDCHTTLQYESRSPGPLRDRPDPFNSNKIDLGRTGFNSSVALVEIFAALLFFCIAGKSSKDKVSLVEPQEPIYIRLWHLRHPLLPGAMSAFMTAASYMNLCNEGNKNIDLLPATPVFAHQMNVENKPGYFSDIIIHSDKKAHNVNTLLDLRGCTFAYSNEDSLSGSKIVLKTLKEKGENASFFGSLLKSGSHLASAQMVLTKQAEWAAVDSTTLLYSKKYMQDGGKEIITLETLGRLPPYPIVINSKLPDEIKKEIARILLTLPQTPKWKQKFAVFGVIKFEVNSGAAYDGPAAQMWASQKEKLNIRPRGRELRWVPPTLVQLQEQTEAVQLENLHPFGIL
ncbi:hypothetical protein RR48_12278 [Papilio machaon]|uniref:Uncharacterized protein n=1 Tax=Papilio machaon TaxID=76193 RepID=A0A194QU59_PAPMA|nr:hypothetical protein RR48_12278 [Papilio machaon]